MASAAGVARRAVRDRRRPDEIDRHVAARLRERRTLLGLTLQRLAERIGVCTQQAQRYETGISRLSAGQLHKIAQALGVEVDYFFAGLEQEQAPPAALTFKQRQTLALARHFVGLSRREQEALCGLARAFAGASGGDGREADERGRAAA